MVGSETLLSTGMFGHVSQINTQRISLCIYFPQLRHPRNRDREFPF